MTLLDAGVVATGQRVRIRSFTRADVDYWQEWPDYEEPLLRGSSPKRMDPEQRDRWFDDLINRQRQVPYSIDDEHGRLIGRLFLRQVKLEEGSAVLGIDLRADTLGQRYGTEAMHVFLPYYFTTLGFQRMLLSVAAYNERARRSYESLGFSNLGTHWDAHNGPDPSSDPSSHDVAHLFRRGPIGLETLFYDMVLEREDWERWRW